VHTTYQTWIERRYPWWLASEFHSRGYTLAVVAPIKLECSTRPLLNAPNATEWHAFFDDLEATRCWFEVNEYACRMIDDREVAIDAFMYHSNELPLPGHHTFCNSSHPRIQLRASPLIIRSQRDFALYFNLQWQHRDLYSLNP